MGESALRYGLFGIGRCGCVHGQILLGQGQHIVALGDESSEAISASAQKLNLLQAARFTDPDTMARESGVDAVVISSHTRDHARHARPFIQAGIPVYLEKPATLNAPSAQRIAEAAQKSGVKISVAHYRRRQPLFRKVKELLDTGAIGEVRVANLQFFKPHIPFDILPWRLDPAVSGGGLFHDLAPHQLDLFYHFFGRSKHYSGVATNTGGYYGAADTVAGQILFEDGVLFNGLWCFAAYPADRLNLCEITGSTGTVTFSVFDLAPVTLLTDAGKEAFHFEPLQHVHQPMIEAVVPYFLGEAPNPCPIEEAVEVMRWIDAFAA